MDRYHYSNYLLRRCLLLLAILLSIPAMCQEKLWLVGIGHTSLLDTYLSQEHYAGIDAEFLHEMTKPYKRDSLWSRTNYYHVEFSRTQPRYSRATDLEAIFDYAFSLQRTFHIIDNLTIAVGGQFDFFLGGIYNNRNGNNPAQAKLGIDLAPTIRLTYPFHIRRQQLRLSYRAALPLIGMQFSPAYGQSYYDLFSRGDYDHNVCLLSAFTAVNYYHRFTIDFLFRHTALTVGYLGTCRQAKTNQLRYHSYTNAFLIGVTL